MATYKVIQDIEAEDKLLGPLSLRQFIYAIIVVVSLFAMFKIITSATWYLALPLLPHTALFAVLAAPFGQDQPSEVWLLAKIRFFLKPRRRIWDQSGIKELVTITVPKKIEKILTDNLSQTEVKSRLEALAKTIDSRGWAVKNVDVNLFSQPSYVLDQVSSDRLIDPSTIPQEVSTYEVNSRDDILDEANNPTAQYFDQTIVARQQDYRQAVIQRMHDPAAAQNPPAGPTVPPNYWFMDQPDAPKAPGYAAFGGQLVQPQQPSSTGRSGDDKDLAKSLSSHKKKKSAAYGHMRTIKPIDEQDISDQKPQATSMPPALNPAILELANNDDLNVATIARQAQKATQPPPDDEVIVSLH